MKTKPPKFDYFLKWLEVITTLLTLCLQIHNTLNHIEVRELKELMTKLINSQDITINNSNNVNVTVSGAYLLQNAPNPFRNNTIIHYHLPQGAGATRVFITNVKGQMLKSIVVNNKGEGQITLDAGMLAAGSYTYSLWVDGRQADTKQMVIQK